MLTYQTLTAGYFPKHTGWFYFSYIFLPPLLLILGQDEKLSELLLDLRYRVNTWYFRTCQTSVLCRSLQDLTTCEMFCSCHLFSQSVAVDVVFKHRLLHAVTDHYAEGTDAVTLLMLLQLLLRYVREDLSAVTTHQRLPGTETRDETAAHYKR